MKRYYKLFLLLGIVLFMFLGCEKSPLSTEKINDQADQLNYLDATNNSSIRGGSVEFQDLANGPCVSTNEILEAELIAGQNTVIGVVTVEKNGNYLDVSYIIEEPDWFLYLTHLHIATDLEDIPHNKKWNIKIGHFDYQQNHFGVTSYTYSIPFNEEWCGMELYFAAHAEVSNNETAWAGDIELPGRRWGFYFTGSFDCECVQHLLGTNTTVDGNAEIYLISPIDGSSDLIATLEIGTSEDSEFNANAYDPDENVFYFNVINGDYNGNLYYYDLDDGSWGLIGQLNTQGKVVSSGCFYDGSYYYGTNTPFSEFTDAALVTKVMITYDNGVPSMGSEELIFTMAPTIFSDISVKNGEMYGIGFSLTNFVYEYFSFDLSNPVYETISSPVISIQIAFGSDDILYGINSANGELYYFNDPVNTYDPIPIP